MKLNKASITILFDRDRGMSIELHDSDSSTTFAEVALTPEQVVSVLSRLSHTPCEIEVKGLEKIGKRHENKYHEFEYPAEWEYRPRDEKALFELAKETAPEGWTPDNHFSSQNTFFEKDGKRFCRVIIRRWV